MRTLKSLAIVFCVSLIVLATVARADEWNKKTKLTFSGPVEVGKTELPAGTYIFKLADTSDRHVVQIFNADETHLIATIMAVPAFRLMPADKTVVKFSETGEEANSEGTLPPEGVPMKTWFYPGDQYGYHFKVYPHKTMAETQTTETTETNEQAAVTPPEAPAAPEETAPAEPEAQAAAPVEMPPAQPQETAPEQPAPEQTAPATNELPQTATQMPLVALMGLLSLAAAGSIRIILKNVA